MASHLVSALVACPLALILMGCGGGAGPTPTPAPTSAPPVEPVRILEWVVGNDVDTFRDLTTALIAPTQAEPGCLLFDIYEDMDPETSNVRIWQYLVFKDKAAHMTHLHSDVVQKWIADINGDVTTVNESSLIFMKNLMMGDVPKECVAEAPGFNVLSEFIAGDSHQEALEAAALELMEPFRATEGVLYYELLLPTAKEGAYDGRKFVQEIMWLKNEAVLESLRSSAAWSSFMGSFSDPALTVKTTKVAALTAFPIPICGDVTLV